MGSTVENVVRESDKRADTQVDRASEHKALQVEGQENAMAPRPARAWQAWRPQARPGAGDGSSEGGLLPSTTLLAPGAHSVLVRRKQPHGTTCREHVPKRRRTEDAKP